MSASTATSWDADLIAPLPVRPTETRSQPRLQPVEHLAPVPARRPRLVYGLIAVAGALAIAGAQLGLSILTTQGTYDVKELTAEKRAVTWEVQMLEDKVAGLSSPQYLAANAAALGMVIGDTPSYMRLSDGAVTGAGKPASSTSNVQALKKAAVGNALIGDVPLVTDPDASLGAGAAAESTVVVNPAAPPAVADGLPTPETH